MPAHQFQCAHRRDAYVVIDILTETLLDLKQAAREAPFRNPRTRKAVHVSAVYRYISRGATATNGERVRLESVTTPGGVRTSREAVVRFIARLSGEESALPKVSPKKRQRAMQAAERMLESAGI